MLKKRIIPLASSSVFSLRKFMYWELIKKHIVAALRVIEDLLSWFLNTNEVRFKNSLVYVSYSESENSEDGNQLWVMWGLSLQHKITSQISRIKNFVWEVTCRGGGGGGELPSCVSVWEDYGKSLGCCHVVQGPIPLSALTQHPNITRASECKSLSLFQAFNPSGFLMDSACLCTSGGIFTN